MLNRKKRREKEKEKEKEKNSGRKLYKNTPRHKLHYLG